MQDDVQRGQVLTRRQLLQRFGMTGAVALGGSSVLLHSLLRPPRVEAEPMADSGACVVRPEQTEGPYFIDTSLERSDIRSDPTDGSVRPGALLLVSLYVKRFAADGGCTPLAGAVVDLWQCDAHGIYSDVEDPHFDTVGKKFLRGYQVTGPKGVASFTTIYPGWYPGRTVHIHFKIRSAPTAQRGFEFTSQLYFDDSLTDRVHALEPYATRGPRTRRNDRDGIYRRGGSQLQLAMSETSGIQVGTLDVALEGVGSARS